MKKKEINKEDWLEHWAMRKKRKFSCSDKSKTIAGNELRRLSKEGYDPNLLLRDATDHFSRKFFRNASCLKARPVIESPTFEDLAKSDPAKAKAVISAIATRELTYLKTVTAPPPKEEIDEAENAETIEMREKMAAAFLYGDLDGRFKRSYKALGYE